MSDSTSSSEINKESFDLLDEIEELEINEENIENSQALCISSGFISDHLTLFKENTETLKIYGNEDYVVFMFGNITPQVDFMNSKFVRSFKLLSNESNLTKLFICHGLIKISSSFIVKYLNEYKKEKKHIIIVTNLVEGGVKKENWADKLEDEEYIFFKYKNEGISIVSTWVFLIVKIEDYIEFLGE
ncbi:hypothetical protein CDIK_0521 [Cucumispora dikerogammari]|nr:hypothetical protein CDIK_0521 [Cucumispora dikerogammari]